MSTTPLDQRAMTDDGHALPECFAICRESPASPFLQLINVSAPVHRTNAACARNGVVISVSVDGDFGVQAAFPGPEIVSRRLSRKHDVLLTVGKQPASLSRVRSELLL